VNGTEVTFFVGTYTGSGSEGIYICRLNAESGAIELIGSTRDGQNPSFLAVAHSNRFVYAVNEVPEDDGLPFGSVCAFRIGDGMASLEPLNKRPSQGAGPCHVAIDKTDRYLFVSNYSGGNLAVLPVLEDGSLGAPVQVVQQEGSGVNPKRQRSPHVHSTTLDPSNRFACVADLGTDRIMQYRFDDRLGNLHPCRKPFVQLAEGAGPRHFAFHPEGKRGYVTNELNSTVTVFDFYTATWELNETQTISALPASYNGENICAGVVVSASGRFVYASNRGHDSVVVFAVDVHDGKLSVVQHQLVCGKTPRSIVIDPTGRFLLVANQDSDMIAVFGVDQETGRLTFTGQSMGVPKPACLRFLGRRA
jgi:6-phosphogluconolactonase